MMRNLSRAAGVAAAAVLSVPAAAQAAGTDYTPLTGSIDAGTVVTAILAVGAIMIVPRLAMMGVKWIKASVK